MDGDALEGLLVGVAKVLGRGLAGLAEAVVNGHSHDYRVNDAPGGSYSGLVASVYIGHLISNNVQLNVNSHL